MSSVLIAFIVAIFLSGITVFADFLIKKSVLSKSMFNLNLIIGAVIYGLSAFGWFFVLKKMKLFSVGLIYALSCVFLITLVSIFYFKEQVKFIEIVALVISIGVLILLYRFA